MIKRLSVIILILFLCFQPRVIGQGTPIRWDYSVVNFGIKEGLPSLETYDVYNDSNGFIWVLTDRGVTRYNGFVFEKFTIENGLADNVNFRVFEDDFKRVWFIGFNGKLSVFENGEMKAYRFNNLLDKNLPSIQSTSITIAFDSIGSLIYSLRSKKIIKISPKGKVSTLAVENFDVQLLTIENVLFELIKSQEVDELKHKRKTVFSTENHKYYFNKIDFGRDYRSIKHQKDFFYIDKRKLFCVRKTGINYFKEDAEVIGLSSDGEFLYVGLYKNGLKKYKFDSKTCKLILIDHIAKNLSVSSASCDSNHHLWFTTLEKGLFFIPNDRLQECYKGEYKLDEEVRNVFGLKDQVMISYFTGKWQQLYSPYLSNVSESQTSIKVFLAFQDKLYCEKGFANWNKWKEINDVLSFNPLQVNGNKIYGQNFDGGHFVYEDGVSRQIVATAEWAKDKLTSGSQIMYHRTENQFYIVVNRGLVYFNRESNGKEYTQKLILDSRISGLKYNSKWGLLASSNTNGLYKISKTNKAQKIELDRDIGEQIVAIFFDENNMLWVVTNKGVFGLKKSNDRIFVSKSFPFVMLPISDVNDLYVYNNVLYLASKTGIVKIDTRKKQYHSSVFPYRIQSINAYDQNEKINQQNEFPASTDLIRIKLSTLNHVPSFGNKYKYRFSENQTWTFSSQGEIVLNEPTDGEYKLQISYLEETGKWSKVKRLVNFKIEAQLYKKWYAWLFYIFILGVIFQIVLSYSMKVVKRKNDIAKRLIELEQSALSAQMNPHFIFNSLNSIHSFLLYEENENAEIYLLKFSKLIRKTLTNSREKYISFNEELEVLKYYIDLEKMRFKNAFDYEINVDTIKSTFDLMLPPMLIQPYVENAIIHGLASRASNGKLTLNFKYNNDLLFVEIIDNGKGYDVLKEKDKNLENRSFGTKITEERLKSFTAKGESPFTISIKKVNETADFPGTIVTLAIPIAKLNE